MSLLEIKNIHKAYGKRTILNGVNMEVEKGQCVALVGANGCGKTTLLGILAGAALPSSGEILINGENALKNKKLFNEYIGYVPQENPLLDKLTVYDNLRFWYCDTKRNLKDDMENGIIKEFGLDVYKDYTINKLSGGLKKRLSIACALASEPKILIMDEPGAALDIVCKEDIKKYLQEYLKNGGTVIITSHEEAELSICDKMYLLSKETLEELPDKPMGSALMERMR